MSVVPKHPLLRYNASPIGPVCSIVHAPRSEHAGGVLRTCDDERRPFPN